MEKKNSLTRTLAIAGSVLVWLPILAPVLFALAFLIRTRMLRIDYLMPAELFPLVLAGGGLLLWAALRAHSQVKWVALGLGGAVGLLALSQALAVISGLASGAIEAQGFWFSLVLILLAAYIAAVIGLGLAGMRLLKGLYPK